MKKKSFFLTAVATLSLATATIAQTVPNYVPTNGLVGWWPFNGNANDESGNNNNGTVNGASLTTDRFGNAGKAYSFDGLSNYIKVSNNQNLVLNSNFSISCWVKVTNVNTFNSFISNASNDQGNLSGWVWGYSDFSSPARIHFQAYPFYSGITVSQYVNNLTNNTWKNILVTYDKVNGILKYYLNSQITDTFTIAYNIFNTNLDLFIGNHFQNNNPSASVVTNGAFSGDIDDIGIWNRALTQQEITDLYNSVNCNNNLAITPQNNVLQIGNTATFTATTSDTNPNYFWQSDFGQGFQTLNDYGNYSGVNTATLSIANVQLPNHTQAIRAISTSGICVDTSNVAYINILDTCITNVTVYDTIPVYTSVTDTLIINVNTVGLNNNTIINTIKVFPNPAHSILNLDFGNYTNLNGYTIKIFNSVAQEIYNQPIIQQSETIDLSTFGGNGIYFLHVINAQNNTVEIRKIVLQ